ncbi:MAG: sulfite exporter TauE/SafE family protein [Coriobacteriales bacterium]|jgi:uncharacterized membrane protein YfcA|nr:sulfite exporter TauE/SafE family protein [Coriobacteriales bacterium]
MTVGTFILIAVCGVGVGILSGMFGIGGGTLIVPLLHLGFGLPVLSATSTSLFTIAPTALSGATKHIRQKTLDLKAGLTIGFAGACTSALGAWASDYVPELLILLLTAAVIVYSATKMFKSAAEKTNSLPAATVPAPNALKPAQAPPPPHQMRARPRLLFSLCLGLIAGLIAGLAGVGGGFMIVPMGIAYLGFSLKEASGTSLVAIALIAIPGIVSHALLGHIWFLYGIALIVGTIPGAWAGAHLIAKLPERPMRLAFGVLLVLSGVLLIINQFVG